MGIKYFYLDFEFNHSADLDMRVICVAWMAVDGEAESKGKIWLDGDEANTRLFTTTVENAISEDYIFVAFAVTAEGRSLLSLDIDPRRMEWIDLQLEFRMAGNSNYKIMTGPNLIKGKIVNLKKPIPKWDRPDDYKTGGKVSYSLSGACFKMLGVKIDTEQKDTMRDLIIYSDSWTPEEQRQILDYCESDIIYLPRLLKTLWNFNSKGLHSEDKKKLFNQMKLRGEYAGVSAVIERCGYAIDTEATRAFSASVKSIIFREQKAINKEFPLVGAFSINKQQTLFQQKSKPIREWVEQQCHSDWVKTDKGELSLSFDAFAVYYSYKNDQTDFGNRFHSFLRLKQSLNGFRPSDRGKNIWDSVGSDGRVRAYFGIYGSQTSRSQPSTTAYVLGKSKWMRAMLQPDPGRCMIALDYSQQEFLLAALVARCENMVTAYKSGDVYFHTAKLAGAVPMDALRKDHEFIRDKFKQTVLSIQYGQGALGLSLKLTKAGVPTTVDEAQDLIDLFYDAYPEYGEWQEETWEQYQEDGYLQLPCGWTLWGDNPNKKSVLNFPIQGLGASILRRGVTQAVNGGLDVTMTLHDAIYVEAYSDSIETDLSVLSFCMAEAFQYYFKGTPMEQYAVCRMDPTIWGPDFDDTERETCLGSVVFQSRYIDEKARKDFKKFESFFIPKDEMDIFIS